MNRLKRQTMIKRLVTENEIHTQSELLALLGKKKIFTPHKQLFLVTFVS